MKALREDAPDRLSQSLASTISKWILPTIFGSAMCLGFLTLLSSIAVQNKLRRETLPIHNTHPYLNESKLTGSVDQSMPISHAHPEVRIHEHAQIYKPTPKLEEARAKQNEFNDRNYVPHGAVNSVGRLAEVKTPPTQPKTRLNVSGIHEQRKVKDLCPDPSSIQGRECRLRIGVQIRN